MEAGYKFVKNEGEEVQENKDFNYLFFFLLWNDNTLFCAKGHLDVCSSESRKQILSTISTANFNHLSEF